jgi:cytochrome P450
MVSADICINQFDVLGHRYRDARKDKMPYLWSVIMEATRLYPAVPGGLPRVTPKGGEVIAGQFIPEGVSDSWDSNGLMFALT